MKKQPHKEGEKKAYEKPKLITIELAADEVLALGCKLSTGGFAFNGAPCVANNCILAGS